MGIQTKRKVIDIGGSRYVAVPSGLRVGGEASIAGNRILLIDPRGEIDATLLLDFMEEYVEPYFWKWLAKKNHKAIIKTDLLHAQAMTTKAAKPVVEESTSRKGGVQK